jgi:hypothetical protein
MAILENSPGLMAALRGDMTPKFLATRSQSGVPNVVPVTSTLPAEDGSDVLFFGNFLLRKTIANLNEDRRVAVLVITEQLACWRLSCDFVEFQRTGPYAERQSSSPLLRYNAYTGIRNAGVMKVLSVDEAFSVSKPAFIASFVAAKAAASVGSVDRGVAIPLAARREFSRLMSVKALAWIGADGRPAVAPALSLQPSGTGTLLCRLDKRLRAGPPPGVPVAANVLTFDAISYQAKGEWETHWSYGTIHVKEVYAGGPPIPGGRVSQGEK